MKNGYTRDSLRRLASLLLAVVVAVTFMPFLGEAAYAEDMDGEAAVSTQVAQSVSEEKADTVITDEELADMEKQIEESIEAEGDEGDVPEAEAVPVTGEPVNTDSEKFDYSSLDDQDIGGLTLSPKADITLKASDYVLNITQNGTTVNVKATMYNNNFRFVILTVDSYQEWMDTSVGAKNVDWNIDMNNYSVGYHTVFLGIAQTSNLKNLVGGDGKKYVTGKPITEAPTYAGRLSVYSTYLNIYPYNMYFENEAGPLYMEFSSDGGKSWGNRYKLRDANLIELKIQLGSMVGNLRPNTTYRTRLLYGTYATYSTEYDGDGKSYFFSGPALYTGTIKTGKATKPKIKSVTCKAVKVKYHKIRWPGYWNVVGGVAFWHKPYTERYYTYKVKVTIKLKKKPGTAGIWVSCSNSSGEKFLKGNKKKYTTTFTPLINYSSKRPKGHVKVKVTVRSGQSKTYGGYSPLYTSKKKKLK